MLGFGAAAALVCGTALFGGLVLLAFELRGRPVDPQASPPVPRHWRTPTRPGRRAVNGAAALIVGAAVWWISALPVAGLIWGVLVLVTPWLLAPTFPQHAAIERTEALEEWVRRLWATAELGSGLEESLTTSVASAPPAIAPIVQTLAFRVQARWPIDQVLDAFGVDMGTTGGDYLAITLQSAAAHRGPIAETLSDLAKTLAAETAMAREIEAKRGESRVTVRMVTGTIIAVVALGALDRAYASPYQSPVGLTVLAAIIGLFALVFAWMRRLIAPRRQIRLLPQPVSRRRR